MPAGAYPDAGDGFVAVGTEAIAPDHPILPHHKAEAADERRVAVMAARVLPFTNLPGRLRDTYFQPACAVFDDLHPVIPSYADHHHAGNRVTPSCHGIIGSTDGRLGHAWVIRIIAETRHDQRDNLTPEAAARAFDRAGDVLQHAASWR
jgi:hypothetical protein